MARNSDGGRPASAQFVGSKEEPYDSADELAAALGCEVLVPTWWPEDVCEPNFRVVRSPWSTLYQILTSRADGAPVGVVAHLASAGVSLPVDPRLPPNQWQPVESLRAFNGQVNVMGTSVRAAVQQHGQTVHLIGYDTEDDVIRVAKSLRVIAPSAGA